MGGDHVCWGVIACVCVWGVIMCVCWGMIMCVGG